MTKTGWDVLDSNVKKKFIYISEKYKNYLNPPLNSIYLRVSDDNDIYFYNIRKDSSRNFFWGDHYRFYMKQNLIEIHYTMQNDTDKSKGVKRRYAYFAKQLCYERGKQYY